MDKETVFSIAEKYLFFLINEKKYDIKKAFLFGSYAKGNAHTDSDIDLALVMPDNSDILELQIQFMFLSRNFSVDIESHAIKEEDFTIMNPLAFEIMKTGYEFSLKK